MQNPLLPSIYERVWRPVAFTLAAAGRSTAAEQGRIDELLALDLDAHVLDVACGPGNTTRRLLATLGPNGRVTGLDAAETMLERARADTSDPRADYVLGDAARMPFDDATFDAATCLGALYLVEDAEAVMDELVRVVRPGGTVCVLTSVHRGPDAFQALADAVMRPAGMRVFGAHEVTGALAQRGLIDLRRDVSGFLQLVAGRALNAEEPASE
jgi:ubiquinone/menaquinone biosynthesis C-methylase UbiE